MKNKSDEILDEIRHKGKVFEKSLGRTKYKMYRTRILYYVEYERKNETHRKIVKKSDFIKLLKLLTE